MGCPYPVGITRDLDSFLPDNPDRPRIGGPGVFLHRATNTYRVEMVVPCGKCPTCLSARATQWAVRCYCELLEHSSACFLTLTYDEEHVPQDGLLVKDDLKKFLRRVRDKFPEVRYFACGEYGDQGGRPHYHAILFGVDFMGDKQFYDGENWVSPTLSALWPKGIATTAPANYSTICYTVGYVAKKIGNPDVFQLMSRQPGLGASYLEKFEADMRATQSIEIEGRQHPIPEYFFKKDEGLDDIRRYRKTKTKPLSWQERSSKGVNARSRSTKTRGKF